MSVVNTFNAVKTASADTEGQSRYPNAAAKKEAKLGKNDLLVNCQGTAKNFLAHGGIMCNRQVTVIDASRSLTAAEVFNGIVIIASDAAAAVTVTLPSAAAMADYLGSFLHNTPEALITTTVPVSLSCPSFDFYLVNLDGATATVAQDAGATFTIIGEDDAVTLMSNSYIAVVEEFRDATPSMKLICTGTSVATP